MVEGVLCSFGAKMKTNLDRYSKVYLVHCLEFCSSNNEKEKSHESKFSCSDFGHGGNKKLEKEYFKYSIECSHLNGRHLELIKSEIILWKRSRRLTAGEVHRKSK